eukprot:GHVP01048174.1.p1 GENE.GHVP01048174.1~~GHVP01048174.1.p1  ORF type:complete len:394 (-),score=68.94 GHVP01048174.1:171-1187(-)
MHDSMAYQAVPELTNNLMNIPEFKNNHMNTQDFTKTPIKINALDQTENSPFLNNHSPCTNNLSPCTKHPTNEIETPIPSSPFFDKENTPTNDVMNDSIKEHKEEMVLTRHSPLTNSLRNIPANNMKPFEGRDEDMILLKLHDLERERNILLVEISSLESKYETVLSANSALSVQLHEQRAYFSEAGKHAKEHVENTNLIEKLLHEKQQIQLDLSALHSSFHDLRLRYDEQKRNLQQLQLNEKEYIETISRYKIDKQSQESKYSSLKTLTEQRLVEADDRFVNVKNTLESECLLLRSKLQKSDIKYNHMEKLLESREKENSELLAICDELMQKIDNRKF